MTEIIKQNDATSGTSTVNSSSAQPKVTISAKTGKVTPVTATSTQTTSSYLDNYNANREQKIRDMYNGAKDSTFAGLKGAYDQNLAEAQRAKEEITPQYQESMNHLGAEYERQKRNNNMQAAVNGLNTGAGSQMALGQMNAYQTGQGKLATAENQAIDAANQGILDLKTSYQNQIAQATANNDYQLAAALLDEYGAQYDRTMAQAKQLADFGDFSMYATIYGDAAAKQMEDIWKIQNPNVAYQLGKISADKYFKITGRYPNGSYGSYGGRGGYSSGGGGGGTRYNPLGHYDGYGNFVNDRTGQVIGSMSTAPGAGEGYLGDSSTWNDAQTSYRKTR